MLTLGQLTTPLVFGAPGRIIRPLRGLTPQGGRSLASLAPRSLGQLRWPRVEPAALRAA